MRTLTCTIAVGLTLGLTAAGLEEQGRGHAPSRSASAAPATADGPAVSGGVQITFSTGDARLIREHYAPRYRSLPPGLQKKVARGGALPPGWQKKMEPFPVALERRLTRLPDGYERGVIDGHAVIYLPGTSVVIDAAVLF